MRTIFVKPCGAQDGVSRSQKGSPATKVARIDQKTSKITQSIALSALVENPTAITLAINRSIVIKWSYVRFSGLETVSPDHKMAPQPQQWPNLAKKK